MKFNIYGEVWDGSTDASAAAIASALDKVPETEALEIHINSEGGSVFEGTAIYNRLKQHRGNKTVIVDGFACSIASVIAMAGDVVIMPSNAMMLIHNMWQMVVGNADDLRKAADDLDKIGEVGKTAYLDKCGDKITAEQLNKIMAAETWLTAQECVKFGFADAIMGNQGVENYQGFAQKLTKSRNIPAAKKQSILQSLNQKIDTKNTEMTVFDVICGKGGKNERNY